jgi:hypothetical protein
MTSNIILDCFDSYDNPVNLTDLTCSYVKLELCGSHANFIINNNYVLIDKEYLPLVLEYKWYLSKDGYPMTHGLINSKNKFSVGWKLHSFLHNNIKLGDKEVIDHINRNKLDNRMKNLRVCTAKENSYNTSKRKGNNTSKYKGVSIQKYKNGNVLWTATISKDGKTSKIKNIETEEEAARIYDMMALELFGEYAGINYY